MTGPNTLLLLSCAATLNAHADEVLAARARVEACAASIRWRGAAASACLDRLAAVTALLARSVVEVDEQVARLRALAL